MKRKAVVALLLSTALMAASLTGCGLQETGESPIISEEGVSDGDASSEDVSGANEGSSAESSEEGTNVASESDYEMEYEYYTDDKDVQYVNIDDVIEVGDKTYTVTDDITYEDVSEEKVVMQILDLDVEEYDDLDETTTYTASNGKKYKLQKSQIYTIEENVPITIPVTYTETFADQLVKPSVASTKSVKYFNRQTQMDETATCSLTSYYASVQPRWKAMTIDGVFDAPEANCDTYTLQGVADVVVSQSAETPVWSTYQSDILTNLELDPTYFRITSAAWNGDQYTQDGKVMRNAYFYGDVYCGNYTAVYEGTGQSLGYKTKTLYMAPVTELEDVPEEDVTTIYKIKAIVKYKLVE